MKGFLGSGSTSGGGKSTGMDTLIGRQTEILGDVRFAGGLYLDGKIKGAVTAAAADKAATLSVSDTGAIEGDVRVPTVMLSGSILGDVHAVERLALSANAKITGDVHYRILQMEPGAQIIGRLHHEDGAIPVKASPPALADERGRHVSGGAVVEILDDGSRLGVA